VVFDFVQLRELVVEVEQLMQKVEQEGRCHGVFFDLFRTAFTKVKSGDAVAEGSDDGARCPRVVWQLFEDARRHDLAHHDYLALCYVFGAAIAEKFTEPEVVVRDVVSKNRALLVLCQVLPIFIDRDLLVFNANKTRDFAAIFTL